jgi:hypothetical protein
MLGSMPKKPPVDRLARRLVAEAALIARFQTNRGFMLETVRRRLDGVTSDKADAAAEYAAAEPRCWIEYRASSVRLLDAGLEMVEAHLRRSRRF